MTQRDQLVGALFESAPGDAQHRHPQILREDRARRADRPRHRCGGTARPQQQRHYDTHQSADDDVLNADQPHLPTGWHHEVEGDQHHHRERGLRRGEGCDLGYVGRTEHHQWHQNPQHHRIDSDQRDDHYTEQEADSRSDHCAPHPGARCQCAAAQHRQCTQDDPEAVFDREYVSHGHRERKADTGTQAVAERYRSVGQETRRDLRGHRRRG